MPIELKTRQMCLDAESNSPLLSFLVLPMAVLLEAFLTRFYHLMLSSVHNKQDRL